MIRNLLESVRGTLWGCAVTILVFMLLLAFEFGLLALDLKPNLKTYSWLIAVCVGGFCGCRQAKRYSWLNWTIFAVLLELLDRTLMILAVPKSNRTFSTRAVDFRCAV